MYSIVLATMLTAGTATPAWGKGCFGCYGCHGCYGCSGWCSGSYGCCGGCCGGCFGCCGGCCGGFYSCYGCSGCCGGCYGCYGAAVYVAPAPAAPATKVAAPAAEARVIVDVPQDAALYIDGHKSKMTSDRRTFVSPVLQPGETYFYDLKAEVVRDGERKTETRRVTISAGQVARVDFRDMGNREETVAAAAPATVTVRLPAKARLLIDGKPAPLTSNVRTFKTPQLPTGKTYYYTLTAEIDRDGETLSQSQRVVLQAGKKVSVTFDQLAPATTNTASR